MRRLLTFAVTLGLACVGVVAPVVTLPVAVAQEVEPELTQIPVIGIDEDAAASEGAGGSAVQGRGRVAGDAGADDGSELAALTPLEYPGPFMAAGLTWDASSPVEVTQVSVRVRESGQWGDWADLEIESTGVAGERAGTQPLLAVGATGIQARVRTADGVVPSGLRIDVVDPGSSPADGVSGQVPAATAGAASGNEIRPSIVTRKQWGADESRGSSWPEVSAQLNAIYIHHTAGTNSYTKAQSAALVRGIYAFHTGARGWPDIGYQFLVDKYGTVYQGRRDAVEDLPIGAQAGGYNTTTIGVSAMGNYDVVAPPAAMLKSIEKVVAWKAYQNGVDPKGTASLITGMSTGTNVKAQPGSTIKVPAVLGHRDTNGTACPGRYLYGKLGSIRTNAASLVSNAKTKHGSVSPVLKAPTPIAPGPDQAPVLLAGSGTYRWNAVAGAVGYQVLTRSASHGSAMADSRSWIVYKTVSGTSASVSLTAGQTRLIAVRAIDGAGNRGAVGLIAQPVRPVAAGSIKWATGKWTSEPAKPALVGTLKSSVRKGATLRVDNVRAAEQVVVFGESGPGYGATEVIVDGKVVGVLNWTSSEVDPAARRSLTFKSAVTGSVRLRTISAARVGVSGLAFARSAPAGIAYGTDLQGPPALLQDSHLVFPVRLSASATLHWLPVSGAKGYRVVVKKAKHGKPYGSWKVLKTTTKTKVKVSPSAGETWRVGVRTIDAKGKFSARVKYPLLTRPVATNSLVRSTGAKNWSTVTGNGYLAGSAFSTATKGATITVKQVKDVRTIQVVAERAPGHGRFAVYVGGEKVKTFSTAGKSKKLVRYTVNVPKRSGTVKVKTLDAKRVRVSAVVTAR